MTRHHGPANDPTAFAIRHLILHPPANALVRLAFDRAIRRHEQRLAAINPRTTPCTQILTLTRCSSSRLLRELRIITDAAARTNLFENPAE